MTDHNIIVTANRLAARMGGRFVLYDKKGPTMSDKVEVARFWQRVEKNGPEDCWPWTGHRDRKGYGLLIIQRQKLRATRVSLEIDGRPRPEGQFALHSCDNPPCVNPAHLRWGTVSENVQDTVERGQHSRASQTHCKSGHPLSGDNLISRFDGHRGCRECWRKGNREYMARRRAKEKANG